MARLCVHCITLPSAFQHVFEAKPLICKKGTTIIDWICTATMLGSPKIPGFDSINRIYKMLILQSILQGATKELIGYVLE